MKILFISTVDLGTNGISTFIINSATYLAVENYVAIAYSNKINQKLKERLRDSGIALIELPPRKREIFSYYKKLILIIKKYNFDIVHVNGNSTTMSLELMAAKRADCNVRIGHAHNTETEHPILNNLLYPIFRHYITQQFACSQEAGQWLFRNNKFHVIENGIKLNNYFPSLMARKSIRAKLKLDSNDILLVNVGGFNFQKNQELLIKMIGLMPTKFKLLLIGDGDFYKKIRREVLQEGLEKRVFFTGSVENVSDYLSASDIFVMPSRFEGFPYALVEAQASGLTCFASNKITKKIDLTGNVKFLSIKDASTWAEKVVQSKYIGFNERVDNFYVTKAKITSEGFSVEENAKELSSLYSEAMNKV